ncbi:hypothetical protein AOQ84DRAFT_222487 [Glonium stellatum]|uniref:Uncharacterized protein n=1 Tax=Glonium stellatum TaxID=574774 RepID=A0A8E2F049_9PEZI|nr:hypothetical protein AOQ84DRAFT_222487 [Glonium stellatum]
MLAVAKQCARAKPVALKGASARHDWQMQPRPGGAAGFLKSHRPLGSMDSFLWPFEAFAARFASNHALAAHLTRRHLLRSTPGPALLTPKVALQLSAGRLLLLVDLGLVIVIYLLSLGLFGLAHDRRRPTPRLAQLRGRRTGRFAFSRLSLTTDASAHPPHPIPAAAPQL